MEWVPMSQVRLEMAIKDAIEGGEMRGEMKKAFEIARRMLARKMSVSDIIDLTGLGEDDITALN